MHEILKFEKEVFFSSCRRAFRTFMCEENCQFVTTLQMPILLNQWYELGPHTPASNSLQYIFMLQN